MSDDPYEWPPKWLMMVMWACGILGLAGLVLSILLLAIS